MNVEKAILLFSLFLGIIAGHRNRYQSKKGLCLSRSEVAMACSTGTKFGEKLVPAIETCSRMQDGKQYAFSPKKSLRSMSFGSYHQNGRYQNTNRRGDKGRHFGRGYGRWRCPSVESLIRRFDSKIVEEKCLENELGWSEATDEEKVSLIMQDLASLAGSLSADILRGAEECARDKVQAWTDKLQKCMTGYDAEEVTALTSAVNNTVSTLCLAKSFNEKCGEFVKTKILTNGDAGSTINPSNTTVTTTGPTVTSIETFTE